MLPLREKEVIERFCKYADSFFGEGDFCDRNIELKRQHTLRVVVETENLCREEGVSPEKTLLALRAALLHDLSRFVQFRISGSFNDAASFDHGDCSAELAAKDGWLCGLSHREAELVLTAVCWHNKPELPELSPEAAEVARIVRDADKLDIFSVLLEHLDNPEDNPAVVFSLDTNRGLSPSVAEAIAAGGTINHSEMLSSVDFLAAKLVWVFDLNYRWSRSEFLRRSYIDRLLVHLPQDDLLICAAERARLHCAG